jgi:diguanylate cyclase (GGDEF)-like protein/PAS domain S-box-containing protein
VELEPSVFETLFETSADPQYLLDVEGTRYLRVNPAFESLTGYSREDLEGGRVRPEDLILPEDRGVLEAKKAARKDAPTDRYEIRIRTREGAVKQLEISVHLLTVHGRTVVLGSSRDITARKRLEERLKEEIDLQKKRTFEAAKATVRIYQLTEKIRNVPRMTAALLDAPDESALLARAVETLVDPRGLHYARASILLAEGDALVLKECRPAGACRKTSYPLSGKSRYAAVAREGRTYVGNRGEFWVPLRSRSEVLGVMEVCFDKEEKVLFDDSETVRTSQEDILRTLAHTVGLMIENLRLLKKIQMQSILDPLTQTYNRRHFDQKLAEEVRRSLRYGRSLNLLMMDVDYFKEINDTWGHPVGDRVLEALGGLFKGTSRDLDVVCRYGGDEFAILLPETDGPAGVVRAERLRVMIEDTAFDNPAAPGKPLKITISLGAADIRDAGLTPGDLVRAADDALYRSKREGRNRVSFASAQAGPKPELPVTAAEQGGERTPG